MAVYIEYAILDNFIIDFILLFAVKKTLKLPTKNIWLILSAILGTVFAVVLPLLSLPSVLVVMLKGVVLPLMCILLCINCKKRYLYSILLTLAYTFVLGGILFALLLITSDYTLVGGTITYNADFPISVYLLALCLFGYLAYRLIKYLKLFAAKHNKIYNCKIDFLENTYRIEGFFDSGNILEKDGLPVVFLTDKILLARVGRAISKAIAVGKKVGLTSVNYATLSGRGEVKCFPVLLSIGDKTRRVWLAMTRNEGVCASLILNAKLFGGKNEDIGVFSETT